MAAATSSLFVVATILLSCLHHTDAQIGVAYGREGHNLPSPREVVNLYKSKGIGAMRIYFPDQETLQALQGSGIKLTIGVGMDEIQSLASSQSAADQWVRNNIVRYASSVDFKYIVVGNEVKMSDYPRASSVGPAMQNVLNALNKNNLGNKIKVTTSIGTELVINAYPPSKGEFSNLGFMKPVINFLSDNGSPLMVNIYPYFAHKFNSRDISLEYALFTMPYEKAVTDFNNGLKYQNVFDALADATYAAIDKVLGASAARMQAASDGLGAELAGGRRRVRLVTSESGWSSSRGRRGWSTSRKVLGFVNATRSNNNVRRLEGADDATVDNARTYYKNLIEHVKKGTPLRPGVPIEVFLFAMFDEDKKNGDGDERYFGLFTPNAQQKYGSLNFGG